MDAKLLQKIEELTLCMIELKKDDAIIKDTSKSERPQISERRTEISKEERKKLRGSKPKSRDMSIVTKISRAIICIATMSWCSIGSAFCQSAEGNVPDAVEYQVLKDLYTNCNGSGWNSKTTWPASVNNSVFGTWQGVGVSEGDITSTNLPNNNLNGGLPTTLGDLADLISLNLDGNSLSGAIPSDIGALTHLEYLYLRNNQFTSLPSSIGGLTSLKELIAHNNSLTAIPEAGSATGKGEQEAKRTEQ